MLYVVATPIGDTAEITLRALQILKEADIVLCESTKEASKLLKVHAIKANSYEVLDEHSKPEDIKELLKMCREKTVALVSDCGTPGFCDPGADLIGLCRKNKIEVRSVLGPSSLMGLLSLAGRKIPQFYFRGFLPAENEERRRSWQELKKHKESVILMDTPYRLGKMLTETKENFSGREVLLCLNLSQENEKVFEGKIEDVVKSWSDQKDMEKAEFMLLVYGNAARL
jgi:16S rRNA (cytidine1402-2'-O)-methyltransferase